MPVVQRTQIADYHLLKSRHFFPGYCILTKNINFGQSVDAKLDPKFTLSSNAGINLMTTGTENISYNSVLSLPIIITKSSRYQGRIWRDGLDFLELILGNNGEYINTSSGKIHRYSGLDYDASAIKRIGITTEGNSDITIDVEFSSNVENVFDFEFYNDSLLTTVLNPYLPEMRTARAFDVMVGLQTQDQQESFRVMTKSSVNFDFVIDEVPLWGSKRPRPVYNWCNYKVSGNFNVLDDINRYMDFVDEYDYDLYKPSFQRYGEINTEISDTLYEFAIDFSDIQSDFNIKFSSSIVYASIQRAIQESVLQSTVQFNSYNYGI